MCVKERVFMMILVVITACSVTLAQGWIQWVPACCFCLICQDRDVFYGENQCTVTITFEDKNLPYVRSKTKTVLIMLFDTDGLVLCEFLPEVCSMNQTACRMVLQCLQHAVHWEMSHRLSSVAELLNLDSTRCPTALSIGEFLAKHSIRVVSNFPNLTRFGPMQFLPVSQTDEHLDAEEISRHCTDTTEE